MHLLTWLLAFRPSTDTGPRLDPAGRVDDERRAGRGAAQPGRERARGRRVRLRVCRRRRVAYEARLLRIALAQVRRAQQRRGQQVRRQQACARAELPSSKKVSFSSELIHARLAKHGDAGPSRCRALHWRGRRAQQPGGKLVCRRRARARVLSSPGRARARTLTEGLPSSPDARARQTRRGAQARVPMADAHAARGPAALAPD